MFLPNYTRVQITLVLVSCTIIKQSRRSPLMAARFPDTSEGYTLSDHKEDRLRACIAALYAENACLAKEKADALQKCASIQKDHTETTAKYRDAHSRWTQSNQIRIKLDISMAKRIKEKDEAAQKIDELTKENAALLQTHADLSQESATLRQETSQFTNRLRQHESEIFRLRAEVVLLKEQEKTHRDQYRAVKEWGDDLQRRIEQPYQKRARSRSRSRSPQGKTSSRHGRPSAYKELNHPRKGPREMRESGYKGNNFDPNHRHDVYRPNFRDQDATFRHRDFSYPARHVYGRPPTSHHTSETTSGAGINVKASDNLGTAFPDSVGTKDASEEMRPRGLVPTGLGVAPPSSWKDNKKNLPKETKLRRD